MTRLDHAQVVAHCLAKPGAWADTPWEGDQVAKVHDKVFAFLGSPPAPGQPAHVTLKCGASREEADEWLARYPADSAVSPYIGRSGWNRLQVGGAIPDDELLEAIDESYARIVGRLPRKHRPEGWDAADVGHV
jgi:predicted DNA-binding protein (MmcQ/YjbR family)